MDDMIDKLNEYRLENRITQEELAEILEVSFVTVNRWFNRRQEPNQIQQYHIRKLISGKGKKK